MPKDTPRPSEGLVAVEASPSGSRPVATGEPSSTKRRWRSSSPAMTSTPVIASASIQWATVGRRRTTASHRAWSRTRRRAASWARPQITTLHVPLSAGNVSVVIEPCACSAGPRKAGNEPSAERKCTA
jgi:hypothetical protein